MKYFFRMVYELSNSDLERMNAKEKQNILSNLNNLKTKTVWSEEFENSLKQTPLIAKMFEKFNDETDKTIRLEKIYQSLVKAGPNAYGYLIDSLNKTQNEKALGILGQKFLRSESHDAAVANSTDNDNSKDDDGSKVFVPPVFDVKKAKDFGVSNLGRGCYSMTKKRRGLMLIINNENFDENAPRYPKGYLKRRLGTQVDACCLHSVFTQLGFEVKIEDDLSVEQIRQTAFSASKTVTSEDDMFVLAILSHGEVNEEIVGTDGFKISTKDIVEIFNNERCPELKTKPKLFIIQACRGDELDYGVSKPKCATEQDSAPIRRDDRMPTDTDILVAYASYAGKASYRNTERGSWFIQVLCQVFSDKAHEMDLRQMLDTVAYELSELVTEENFKQACNYHVTLFRPLFFNPGLYKEDEECEEPPSQGCIPCQCS